MIKILNKTRIVRIVSFQPHFVGLLDPRHYTSRPSFQMSDVESRMFADVGCQIWDVGCRMSDVECRISDVECWMSNLVCRISDIRCRISDVGCRMAPISFRTTPVCSVIRKRAAKSGLYDEFKPFALAHLILCL